MAGSITFESPNSYFGRSRSVIAKCITDASGAVSGINFASQGGQLYSYAVLPTTGVTDLFDLTLKQTYRIKDGTDLSWADILGGQGANLSNSTNGDVIVLSEPAPIIPGSLLEPIIANGGNAQTIYLVFNFWEEVA